jgi:hypothetical protein
MVFPLHGLFDLFALLFILFTPVSSERVPIYVEASTAKSDQAAGKVNGFCTYCLSVMAAKLPNAV